MTRDSEKKETGKFDTYTVRNWLGHERIQTTENYIRDAEQYYNQLPVDWIGCVPSNHKIIWEESTAKTLIRRKPTERHFWVC